MPSVEKEIKAQNIVRFLHTLWFTKLWVMEDLHVRDTAASEKVYPNLSDLRWKEKAS